MKKFKYVYGVLVAGALPLVTFALTSGSGSFTGIKGLIADFGDIIVMLTKLVAGVALLVFFWGLTRFIAKAGDPRAKEEGRSLMIWGIIAFFVMISIWGIVNFIQSNLGIGGGTMSVPTFTTTP